MTDGTGNDRWERVKSAFAEAVELQGEARAAYLGSLTADERREVASLLQGHERTDVFVAPTLVDAEHATRPAAREPRCQRPSPRLMHPPYPGRSSRGFA